MDKWKDDIEKYRSGKLTPAERHALEKKALDDPFLADALEGIEEVPADGFSADVDDLNRKILGQKKNKFLWPLRIAASIIGIAVISSIIIYVNSDNIENLASNKEKESESKTIPEVDSVDETQAQSGDTVEPETKSEKKTDEPKKVDETLVAVLKEKKSKPEKPTEETLQQSLAGAGGVSQSSQPTSAQGTSGGALSLSDTLRSPGLVSTIDPSTSFALDEQDDSTVLPVVTTAPTAESTPRPERSRIQTEKKSMPKTASALSLIVSGVVRDQQGQPIPGVNIVAKGSTNGTVTNTEGKYSIEVPGNDQTLVYSFIGYEAQEQTLKKIKDGNLDVKLEEDVAQLSEVVVTGYGEKRDNSEPVVRLAEPAGGRRAYDQYLDEKKMYPQQAIENKIEGKVTIEFTVGVTGSLSDFQVTKALGYGCDEEVIRLVREGPQWKPTYIDNEAVESLVRIKTKFKLPGK